MYEDPKPYIRFCDTDTPIYDDDKMCNGIVGIVFHVDVSNTELGAGQVVASGIFIDDRHLLTAYTPFRQLRKIGAQKDQIYIHYLDAKAVVEVRNASFYMGYFYGTTAITCARQVVPVAEEDITEDQWHDPDHTHTPLHDLMVMKTKDKINFTDVESWHDSNLVDQYHNDTRAIHSGPLLATVADAEDDFPEKFKIISLGYMDWDHVYNKNHLHTSKEYELDDKVREDCDEWFPKDWGYFICIKNDDNFVSIGSGALLVDTTNTVTEKDKTAKIKVFGIGSFMLKKGEGSILVFTDVRPYKKEINRTCNYYDFHDT